MMKNSASPHRYLRPRKKCLTRREYRITSLGGCYEKGGTLLTGMVAQAFVLLMLTWGRADSDIGAEWNPTGSPVGGGPGYSDTIRHQDADFVVHNKSQLLNALSSANYGDIVYIWDTCEINMTGTMYTSIPTGVTVASGRGRRLADTISWGALLYFDAPNSNNGDIFTLSAAGGKVRVTGLRFRGSYSELEGNMTPNDSFAEPVPWETAIAIWRDSCEIDNCEFWGFGKGPVNLSEETNGNYIHHCYVHHQRHIYHGYGFNFAESSSGIVEACYFDDIGPGVSGSVDTVSRYEARYNISGRHGGANVYERHGNGGNPPYAGADYVHHNTIKYTGYGNYVTTFVIRGAAVDSVRVHSNWCWAQDSAHSFGYYSDSLLSIWGNSFTPNPPSGLSGRIPIAVIATSVDSGTAPLMVTFEAGGSYDPDGQLTSFYWHFGDSCKNGNWKRNTNINASVQHTYNEIGKYTVTLMVVDNDGISSYAYKTINVKPGNTNRRYLSCWIKDRFHGSPYGYYSKQVLLNNWICWEKDVAGGGTWEHVIIDITDSLAEWDSDSMTVSFRLYCKKDTSNYSIGWLKMYIDDVVIYGADVINGDFESGTWTGTSKRTDGHWIPDCNHNGVVYYQWDWYLDTNGGVRAYHLGKRDGPHTSGNWSAVSQKVMVKPLDVHDSIDNDPEITNRLSYPFPNPLRDESRIDYQLSLNSRVSLKVYDISGRLVKTLVNGEKDAGFYDVYWDSTDDNGKQAASGVYFYRLVAEPIEGGESYEATRKLIVLK